jgi:transketolase
MRNALCQALVAASGRPEFVFLTGDLGFKALEPLRDALGPRFVNAGVAEQNMVSVAAGLASSGYRPWVYSIAPFVYARPFEQVRNDVCFHRLPVVLVGNGGGYGYGVMGATHHALEDYGALLCLPHMRAYVPAFARDLDQLVDELFAIKHPAYLRLGLSEEPAQAAIPAYASWRRLQAGPGWLVLATGPLAGNLWSAARALEGDSRPTLWALSELPCQPIPEEFQADLYRSRRLLLVEEHVEQGGVAQNLALALASAGIVPERFVARSARGYLSGRYGSQDFHRRECGLDGASIVEFLKHEGRRDAA